MHSGSTMTKGQKERAIPADQETNAAPESTTIPGTHHLSLVHGVILALAAVGAGVLHQHPSFRNSTLAVWTSFKQDVRTPQVVDKFLPLGTPERKLHTQAANIPGTNEDETASRLQKPEFPCTQQKLAQFWHDQEVSGFNIICFDRIHHSDTAADGEIMWSIEFYKGGTKKLTSSIKVSESTSWQAIRTTMTSHLSLPDIHQHHQPWAIFTPHGQDLVVGDFEEPQVGFVVSLLASRGLSLLFSGGQFEWPGVRVGFTRSIELYSIMPHGSPFFKNMSRAVTLETLSLVPLVLSVEGFLSDDECTYIQETAEPHMEYSEVTLMDKDQGRPASDFRTSQSAFIRAHDDAILTDIDYRTASLVRIPRRHQEDVQVLRYDVTEKYDSHADYFDPALYTKDKRTLALIRNGHRNRMATVFWYLSDVEKGGETVFPRFNGAQETSMKDCKTGLKVKPEKGKVIIFYSMTPDGALDEYSLHGACPVQKGTKWAANKWVWNEPMQFVPS